MKKTNDKSTRLRLGWVIFFILAILTVIEFLISTYVHPATPYLIITAIIKGWMIIHYFMHISQLWRKEGDH